MWKPPLRDRLQDAYMPPGNHDSPASIALDDTVSDKPQNLTLVQPISCACMRRKNTFAYSNTTNIRDVVYLVFVWSRFMYTSSLTRLPSTKQARLRHATRNTSGKLNRKALHHDNHHIISDQTMHKTYECTKRRWVCLSGYIQCVQGRIGMVF